MGEQADILIEEGMLDHWGHLSGLCDHDGPCQYCHEALDEIEQVFQHGSRAGARRTTERLTNEWSTEQMATNTIVGVTGILKFCDLDVAVPHPDYPEGNRRFRLEMQTPQANESELEALKKIITHVGKSTWVGAEATKRMRAVARTIEEGDGTSSGQIGLLNGDEYKPAYNEGSFVIRASARANEKPIFRDEKNELTERSPKPGDLVKVSIEVWAMKQHSRINFTVKGVRCLQQNYAPVSGGHTVTADELDQTLETNEETLELFAGIFAKAPAIAADAGAPDDVFVPDDDDDDDEDLDDEEVEELAKATRAKAKPKATRAKAKKSKAVEPDEIIEPAKAKKSGGTGLFDNL